MRRVVFALTLALIMAWVAVQIALAHATPEHCLPGVSSTVAQAPTQVVCMMSRRIDGQLSTMSVWDASGNQVDKKDARLVPNDPDQKTLVVSLDPDKVKDGIYTVKWHTFTPDDNGVVNGMFQFVVGSASVTPFPPMQDMIMSPATATPSQATPSAGVVTSVGGPTNMSQLIGLLVFIGVGGTLGLALIVAGVVLYFRQSAR
jgi:copper transport protein